MLHCVSEFCILNGTVRRKKSSNSIRGTAARRAKQKWVRQQGTPSSPPPSKAIQAKGNGKDQVTKRLGRPPTFLETSKQKVMIKALTMGLPPERACDAAGVSPRTYYRLMAKGERIQLQAEKEAVERYGIEERWLEFVEPVDTAECSFCQAIKKSVAEFHLRCAEKVESPGDTQWQAFMTKLERRDPEHWGRKYEPLVPPTAAYPTTTVNLVQLSVEQLKQLALLLDAAHREEAPKLIVGPAEVQSPKTTH